MLPTSNRQMNDTEMTITEEPGRSSRFYELRKAGGVLAPRDEISLRKSETEVLGTLERELLRLSFLLVLVQAWVPC